MKKLRAFTLIELLIGMIISSIVIGFGYAAYSLIYKQYLGYKNVKERLVETAQLNQILSNDLLNAENISFDENTLSLLKKNPNILQYQFLDTLILRKENEVTDTFRISPVNIQTTFLLRDNKTFLKQFSFDADALGEKEHFTFTKNYSAETLMNYEPLVKNQ